WGAPSRLAAELVSSGLWEKTEGGWLFHDWPDYQPTRAQVQADRARTAERQAKHRDRAAKGQSNASVTRDIASDKRSDGVVTNDVTNASVTVPRPDPVPIPSRERETPALTMVVGPHQ